MFGESFLEPVSLDDVKKLKKGMIGSGELISYYETEGKEANYYLANLVVEDRVVLAIVGNTEEVDATKLDGKLGQVVRVRYGGIRTWEDNDGKEQKTPAFSVRV